MAGPGPRARASASATSDGTPPRLERGLAADRDRDVGELRVRRRAVPMLLAGRDDDEGAGRDPDFLLFRGDDALALGHVEHLVEVVGMEDVDRALVEVDQVGAQVAV